MKPSPNTERLWRRLDTPLGPLWLAASRQGLAGVWFERQRHEPAVDEAARGTVPAWAQGEGGAAASALLTRAAEQLSAYFERPTKAFDLPLDPGQGTAFQQTVWAALRAIPAGRTETYAGLAERIGRPRAVRAVGAAIGRNPWSIVVPCHRVVGRDGSLTGYAGGIPRKQALLDLEAAASGRLPGLSRGATGPGPEAARPVWA